MYNLEKPCVHKILQDPVLDLRLAIRFVRHVRKEVRQYTTYSKQEGGKNKTTKNAFGDHCTYWQGSNVLVCTCNIEPLGLCSTVLSISDKKSYTVVVTINPFPGGGPMF